MIKTWKKIMIAGTAAALAVLLVPVSAIASAKDDVNRLVPGTVINGIPVSGMTPQDAKSYMEGFFNGNYTLKLRDKNGNKETIRDTDIGLEMQVTGDIGAVLTDQNARGRENARESTTNIRSMRKWYTMKNVLMPSSPSFPA